MTAKEYLSQLKTLNARIESYEREKERMVEKLSLVQGISYDKVSVQTSKSGDGLLSNNLIHFYEFSKSLDKLRVDSIKKRVEILTTLSKVTNPLHYKILYKYYMEERTLEEISCLLHYSYIHIKQQHLIALETVQEILDGTIPNYTDTE